MDESLNANGSIDFSGKSPIRYSRFFGRKFVDEPIVLNVRNLTPEQIKAEQEEAEERAANF